MIHENDDKVWKCVSSDGSSCWHTFARIKKISSHVKHPTWLCVQLLILLTGQASCYHSSTPLLSSATTAETTAESQAAILPVNVTTFPLSTTTEALHGTTAVGVAVTTTLNTATTTPTGSVAVTTSEIPTTTTSGLLSATLSTTAESQATTLPTSPPSTTAEALHGITVGVAVKTTLNVATTTPTGSVAVATSEIPTTTKSVYYFVDITVDVNGENMNESEIEAWLIQVFQKNLESCKSPSHEEAATTAVFQSTINTSQPSDHRNSETAGLLQDIEVNCIEAAKSCAVLLKLKQSVSPCCILRTLCANSRNLSNIHVVGKKADRASQLLNECYGDPEGENSCIYYGRAGASCEESESAYVVHQSNASHCIADTGNSTCNCSAYCSRSDAYYTFQISTKDPGINGPNVLSALSKIKQTPNCSLGADAPCPLSIIASRYKDANVMTCGSTATNCMVILGFTNEVPICDVSEVVENVFGSEEQISVTGPVTRAAICGNSATSDNLLKSQFVWVEVNVKPANFCMAIEESSTLNCQKGKNVVVMLEEQCVKNPSPQSTQRPTVTTAQPNTTTLPVNVTTSPPNTTAAIPTTTKSAESRATTLPANVTTSPPNTTTEALHGTTTDGVAVTTTLNTTTTNSNGSLTVTTSEIPTTTTSAESQATTLPLNVTTSPPSTTAEALHGTTTVGVAVTTTHNAATATPKGSVAVTTSEIPTTTKSAESQAKALLEMTRNVSRLNSSQVDELVAQLENLLSGPTISLALGELVIDSISNLLRASPEVLSKSSNRIIQIVDTVALKLVLVNPTESILAPDLGVAVRAVDGANFQETFFSISDPNTIQVRGNPRARRSVRNASSIPQGSISLPESLTNGLTSEEQQLVSRVQFNFYQRATVFQDKSLGERRLISGVLGSSVANLTITGLQDDVVIRLKNTEGVPANYEATCVFWDFALNDGSGGWNSSGCFVRNATDNETVCSCSHLTSFAILLDLSREPITSRAQATILTFITYIGCGLSAIFLSVTLLTYLAFGKLRKDIPSKILIQLCLALLLLNLVFLVDAWLALYTDAVGLCISTAWFLHYFLLVTFTWMGLEAVNMYLALVKVFNSYVSHYMLKFSLAGWGVPMVVVIIVIAVDKDNYGLVSYGRFPDGTSDDFCWLKNDIAFYVAVVAYFCVIFLFNLIMFIVVLVQLRRLKKQNPHNSRHRSTLQDARSVVGITLLLGLTWGFAFFAWGPVNLPFMYLFAIFNSLQGFFIFLFHCAVKENVRRQWRTSLCCGRMRLAENSVWSRTATQKTAKKSSVTKLTSIHSSKSSRSNNSSSSSSFLTTGYTEQSNGIGSPFEDRVITADEDPTMDVILNEINRQYIHDHQH